MAYKRRIEEENLEMLDGKNGIYGDALYIPPFIFEKSILVNSLPLFTIIFSVFYKN